MKWVESRNSYVSCPTQAERRLEWATCRSYAPLGLFAETSTVPQAYAMGLPYYARCAGWDHAQARSVNCADVVHQPLSF